MTENQMQDTEVKTPQELAREAIDSMLAEMGAKRAEKTMRKAEKDAGKQAEKDAKKAVKAAAKQAKIDAKAAAKAEKRGVVETRPEQNGVRQPKPESDCGRVWALANELSEALGSPIPVSGLVLTGEKMGLNASTLKTQYSLWRKFHGIKGRISLPAPLSASLIAEGQE